MPWPFNSHESLVHGGYVWRYVGRCASCRERILWYTNVDRKLVPVDPVTFMLHFASCRGRTRIAKAEASGKLVNIRKPKKQSTFDFPDIRLDRKDRDYPD
jgi:hypothetical protein